MKRALVRRTARRSCGRRRDRAHTNPPIRAIKTPICSECVFEDYDAIIDAACDAWNQLIEQPETIKSIDMRKWAHVG